MVTPPATEAQPQQSAPQEEGKEVQAEQQKTQPQPQPQQPQAQQPQAQQKPAATTGEDSTSKSDVEPRAADDPEDELEREMRRRRAPLAERYAPFIAGSDTSLEDARRRLRKALDQTRILRAAFTERVYGKYRVCLRPPPSTEKIIKPIREDPIGVSRSLQERIRALKEEKEIEKKEAQKLTAELNAAASSNSNGSGLGGASFVNADNADQLMFTTAGLSLVILPEHDPEAEGIDMSIYPDRAPHNVDNGQRVRAISNAAATAGEVMLDRTRKGAAMRAERQRRRQLQLAAGAEPSSEANYSRLSLLSVNVNVNVNKAAPDSTAAATKATSALVSAQRSSKRIANSNAQASTPSPTHAKVQANMSLTTLLSLHPSAEDLKSNGHMSAATLALIELGGGSNQKNITPETEAPITKSEPIPRNNHSNPRVLSSLSHVINQFPDAELSESGSESKSIALKLNHKRRKISKLGFLLGLQRSAASSRISKTTAGTNSAQLPEIHPMLATLVLRAVGIVRTSDHPECMATNSRESVFDMPSICVQDTGGETKPGSYFSKDCTLFTSEVRSSQSKPAPPKQTPAIPPAEIRGGGGGDADNSKPPNNKPPNNKGQSPTQPQHRQSPAGRSTFAGADRTAAPRILWDDPSAVLLNQRMVPPYNLPQPQHQLSMANFGNGQGAHPVGNLTDYLGGLRRQPQRAQYDWSAAAAANMATSHSSLAALGLTQHQAQSMLSAQDRAAARAFMAGEQQNAAVVAAAHAAAAANHQNQRANAFLGSAAFAQQNPHFSQLPAPARGPPVMPPRQNVQVPASAQSTPPAAPTSKGDDVKPAQRRTPTATPVKEVSRAAGPSATSVRSPKRDHADQPPLKRQADEQTRETPASVQKKNEPITAAPKSVSMAERRPAGVKSVTGNAILATKTVQTKKPNEQSSSPNMTLRLRFLVPPAPASVPSDAAEMVLDARFHDATDAFEKKNSSISDSLALIEYLVSVGTAVPIPKAIILVSLKDRLNIPGIKAPPVGSTIPTFREVVASSILLYLWKHHEHRFQDAFSRSGRIDVDSQCKWLIQSAANICTSALLVEVRDWVAKDAAQTRAKNSKNPNPAQTSTVSTPQYQTKLALLAGSVASKMLAKGFSLDKKMDFLLPIFSNAVDHLDECRTGALKSKMRERVLLANFMARRATISLPFSNAYVTSLVRAGAAVGHDELFEIVQNEGAMASTLTPCDVFTDELGAWEDPCRPPESYPQTIDGGSLMRRAHARAMIHKSLKKLQDRHHISGGTNTIGPYVDHPQTGNNSVDASRRSPSAGHTTPRGSLKRQRSLASEPPIQAGTGSARATNWALYESNHHSAPLIWRSDDVENGPYGRFNTQTPCRSLSLAMTSKGKFGMQGAHGMYMSDVPTPGGHTQIRRSTQEISWGEVGAMFAPVEIPKPSSKSLKKQEEGSSHGGAYGIIFAPYVRKINPNEVDDQTDEEMLSDEDISDESMLKEHHAVLDTMKQKLAVVLEARQQQEVVKKY